MIEANNLVIFGIFMVILIILYYNYSNNSRSDNVHDLLSGFWESSVEFCDEVGLDIFCMYIDDKYDSSMRRGCYILAQKDDEFVINSPCSVIITEINNTSNSLQEPKYFKIVFEDLGEHDAYEFSNEQTLKFYPIYNRISLYNDNNVITTVMYKNAIKTTELNFNKAMESMESDAFIGNSNANSSKLNEDSLNDDSLNDNSLTKKNLKQNTEYESIAVEKL